MSTSAALISEISPSERIARSMIDDMSSLVSPPEVCLKVNELVAHDGCAIDDISIVILRDPNLVARVLKTANSAYYGLPSKVDTISRAVALLGMHELQKIVCSVAAVETFSKLSSAVTNMNSFWRHGVYTGLMAQNLARRARVLHPERLFVAGLLHDLGTLLINQRFPELAETAIRESAGSEDALYRIEDTKLGFNHAYLTGLMLENWHLPAALSDAICWHHLPHRARIAPIDAAILKVADTIANFSGTGSFSETVAREDAYDAEYLDKFGLSVQCTNDELMDEVDQQFVETIYLLLG